MQTKWFSKVLAVGLAGTIVLSATACGNAPTTGNTSGSSTDPQAPIKVTALSIWDVSDIRPEKDKTLVGEWLEKELNMDLQLVTIPNEAVTTKINAMATSNSLPTILFKTSDSTSISELNKLGDKGLFLNINEHLDKLPNYANYLKNDFIRREMSDVKGNIYGFAKVYSDENIMYSTPIIRQDLLAGSEFSADSIQTLDDLTKTLNYLTQKTGTPAWIQRNGYAAFMEKSSLLWNLSYKTFYDYEKDAFTHPIKEARFKEYIQWLYELRKAGVIHPDWAIMTDEAWEGLLASNKGSFTLDRMSIIGDSNFSKSFDWQPVSYPTINGKAYLQPNQVAVNPKTAWAINAKADPKEIDKALEFIDFLYDEKNHETLTMGFENKTYTRENPNTMAKIRWLIQIYGENADNPNAEFLYQHGIQSFTRLQTPIDMTTFPGSYPEIMYKQIEHIKQKQGGFRPSSPTVSFSSEIQTKLSTMETSMNTYFDEGIIAFIEGKRGMDTWDAFVADVEKMGVNEVLGYYNEAYQAYKQR